MYFLSYLCYNIKKKRKEETMKHSLRIWYSNLTERETSFMFYSLMRSKRVEIILPESEKSALLQFTNYDNALSTYLFLHTDSNVTLGEIQPLKGK